MVVGRVRVSTGGGVAVTPIFIHLKLECGG